ncbi:phosphoenolpyruvate carboxylase [Natronospira proteinivora]|uniref:Phosphoenolpyruvate carboxylase n=1 Tax=Natronospira proteinivora TaxID=1807133 RepID=A0ABT1G9M5_9GAMM|nr:phosphoenolpyruvate carboxylase [Natronospira proteinivora]MCP1728012.1 phosphoenolpyruvate carboxylase [Natronospira proteinivora]
MSRRDIQFAAKDQPLRDDVSELGALVGAMLREQGGVDLYEQVEEARRRAIRRREGHRAAAEQLADSVSTIAPDQAAELIRAFSTYFQTVNLAERVHRIRRRRDYEREDLPQPEGLRDSLEKLQAAGVGREEIIHALDRVQFVPVFTAHPTESMRRSLLEKQQRLARLLVGRMDPEMTPREDRATRERMRMEITSAWQTEEHPSERPSVADEMEHVLFYFTDVLYRVIPPFYEAMEEALKAVWPDASLPERLPPLVRFGSWVGGDMDGNPNVNADTVRSTLAEHRQLVIQCYQGELDSLYRRLSQSVSRVGVAEPLSKRVADYQARFPQVVEAMPARHRSMPYRAMIRFMQARLAASARDESGAYGDPAAFVDDILLMVDSLAANRGAHAGLFSVRRLYRRASTFGFHMAALDIRQDSEVHRQAVGEYLGIADWSQWTPEKRANHMRRLMSEGLPATAGEGEVLTRTLAVFEAIAESRRRFGPEAIGTYIISMARGPEDLLAALFLARAAGLGEASGNVPLDIVPLLETVPDLERGPDILASVLGDPVYGEHLAARGQAQEIMVGYSDSNKESGIAASRWAVQKAQAQLVAAADAAQVEPRIFHGRGGSTSRGGGKTPQAVLATPAGSVRGRLRVTEQGEVISAKYGLRSIAMRTLEQNVGATLRASIPGQTQAASKKQSAVMDTIASASRSAFRELVYETPAFETFFAEMTPIDVIQRMSMGSRPASRRKGQGIEDLRAIPWVFAWTQCRALLPGWYGLGAGLAAAEAEHGQDTLNHMVAEWPFLRVLLSDVEMVLAKSDMAIAEHYSALVDPARRHFFQRIQDAHAQTVAALLRAKGREELLEDDPVLARTIRLRNPYVDPMSLLQVDLLKRWRAGGREDEGLLHALIASVNGIAQGLQNTG